MHKLGVEKSNLRELDERAIRRPELDLKNDHFEVASPIEAPEALVPPGIEKFFKRPLLTESGVQVQDSVRELFLEVRECLIKPEELTPVVERLKIQLKGAKQETEGLSNEYPRELLEEDRQTYENLDQVLNNIPKLQEYQKSLKTWLDADSNALVGAGQQRTLRLPDWFQVQELEQKTLKAAQASGIFQDFTQEELKEFEKTKNFTAEIEEHHRIAQQEVKRLTRRKWFFKSKIERKEEQKQALRESLLQSKQELEKTGQEGSKWVEKYDILLSQLGAEQALSEEDHQENYQELVATSGQQSLSGMEFYEQELSRLYPTKTKPMSEGNVKILGTLFRLGQMNPFAWTMPQEPVGIAYTAEEILTKKIASRALPTGQEKSVIERLAEQKEKERKQLQKAALVKSQTQAAQSAQAEKPHVQNSALDPVQGALSELQTGLGLKENTAEVCYDLERLSKLVSKQVEETKHDLETYQPVDPNEARDYGNKHANLVRQKRLVEALQLPGIVVPMPHGVRTQQVHNFLQSHVPEVLMKWDQLGKAYQDHTGPELFLKTELAQKLLAEIDLGIQKAFENQIEFSAEMLDWIKELQAKGRYLMVRSTGAEDSKENANAGGNLSEAYIEANPQAVSRSVGNVVRSYFSQRSLENRINAGRNPFAEDLRLAVTTQELIGEPVSGTKHDKDIPRSLVLFSNEPLFVNGEEFRVMRLSATYGHGEGVVGNQGIGTDTVVIINSLVHPDQLRIFYENHEKPTRLSPVRDPETGQVNLQQVPNPPELVQRRVFNDQQLSRLFQWGLIGEAYFGGPTDMEIVVLGDTVYPVQGRPVNRPDLLPAYLDLAGKTAPVEASLRVDSIVSGKGSVLEITEAHEVLVASTLEQAERSFDKNKHRLVIVSQKEPANSHPVVNFSSMGMPCLYVAPERMDDIGKWLKQMSQKSMVLCSQSGSLHLWNKNKGAVKDFTSNGYVAHPAQLAPSFELKEPIARISKTIMPPRDLEDLILSTNMAATPQEALENLQKLRNHDWVKSFTKSREALEERLRNKNMFPVPVEVQRILEATKQLETRLEQAFQESELAISQQQGRLRSLLQTKILAGFLFGDGTESLNQFSIATIKPSIEAAQEIVSYQEQLEHPARFTDILLEGFRTPDSENYPLWKEFLLQLEKLPEEQTASFREMMHSLQASGEMSIWMTLFFRNAYRHNSVEQALEMFSKQYPTQDRAVVQEMLGGLEQIHQMKTQLKNFEEREKFESAFDRLREISKLMDSSKLQEPGGVLVNTIRLRLMNEFISLYDSSIKKMKMSTQYQDQEKVGIFRRMLSPLNEVMQNWLKNLGGEEIFKQGPISMDYYLGIVDRIIQETIPQADPRELQASRGFNVAAAKIGSGAFFKRHQPKTLEDSFTLIHQNLLAIVGHANSKNSALDNLRGGDLTEFSKMAKEIPERTRAVHIGTEVTEDAVFVQYQVPLDLHSAAIELRYDRTSQKTSLKVNFLGESRFRWEMIEKVINILGAAQSVKHGEQGLEYSCDIQPGQLRSAITQFNFFIMMTYDLGLPGSQLLIPFFTTATIIKAIYKKFMQFFTSKPN